jgi:hypothetical protein
MFIATFNNVSVFYHTSAVGMGIQDAHTFAIFNIQSFTTQLLGAEND